MPFATEQFDQTSFEKYLTILSCHMSAEDKDEADPTVIEDRNLGKQAPINNAGAKTIEEVDEFQSMVAENFWENRPKGTEYLDIDVILVEYEGTKTTI